MPILKEGSYTLVLFDPSAPTAASSSAKPTSSGSIPSPPPLAAEMIEKTINATDSTANEYPTINLIGHTPLHLRDDSARRPPARTDGFDGRP